MADFREFQKQYNSYLMHHGILGMHWGIRRYQNPDGSLTPAGQKRYETNKRFRDKIDKKRAEDDARYEATIEADKARDRLIKKREELFKNDKQFSKVVDRYLQESPRGRRRVEQYGYDYVKNWYMKGDAWQDAEDEWWAQTYATEDYKKVNYGVL